MIVPTISLAILSALPWTYAGFMANPLPVPPPAASLAHPLTPLELPLPTADPQIASPDSPRRNLETVKRPASPRLPPPATSTRYRLADLSGQVWEHPDAATLEAFVQQRNEQVFGANRVVAPLRFRSRR